MKIDPRRVPLMAAAAASLAAAVWGGILRLDWDLPLPPANWISHHGALMVSGFLGTLICLERAVGLGRRWAYAAPLLTALGAGLLLAGPPDRHAPLRITLGSLGLVVLFGAVLRSQPTLFHAVMAAGAVCWLAGNLLWMSGRPVPELVLWWAGFLVLTIAGERLEMTRLLRPGRGVQAAFLLAASLFLSGACWAPWAETGGQRLAGAGLLALALWLFRHDIARRTVSQAGLPRFVAICLLCGYAWLGMAGVLAMALAPVRYGFGYDAVLHAVFLGFVMSMIFGHAPIVLPAVLKVDLPYRPRFYVHLAALHGSLALRVAGDLGSWNGVRAWGGMLNAAAVLLFLVSSAGSAIQAKRLLPDPHPDA